MELDRDWIAGAVGGTVTRMERTTTGSSRATWLIDVEQPNGEALALVARVDTGDGPLSGTVLSLPREGTVYRALDPTPVLIPHLYAMAPDGTALLVQRMGGTEDLSTLQTEEAREQVSRSFIRAMAQLHRLDPDSLELPGYARPQSGPDHALLELDTWEGILDERVHRPIPFLRFAFRWMRQHAPQAVERTVLCHGDIGAGNFMFADGEVTALLDWEFAHVGDPMDDVGWLSVRGYANGGMGDLNEHLRLYTELTGIEIRPERARYYQFFCLLKMAVCCQVALDQRGPGMSSATYFNLLPALCRQMADLLGGFEGMPAAQPVALEAVEAPQDAEVLAALRDELQQAILPAITTPAMRLRVGALQTLIAHLETAQRLGPAFERNELDDMAELLGSRPPSITAGDRQVEVLVRGAQTDSYPRLITYFRRSNARRLDLWPGGAGRALRVLPEFGQAAVPGAAQALR